MSFEFGEGVGATNMGNGKTYGHIVRTPGTCGGKPRIDGHRIRVQDVAILYEQMGNSPDEICDAFPGITLGQVHAALAYFYDHRQDILEEIEAGIKFAEEFRRQHPEHSR